MMMDYTPAVLAADRMIADCNLIVPTAADKQPADQIPTLLVAGRVAADCTPEVPVADRAAADYILAAPAAGTVAADMGRHSSETA